MGVAEFFSDYQIIITAMGGIFSVLLAYFINMRSKNEKVANNAIVNQLLPFYNSVLKILNRLDLIGKTEFKIKDFNLDNDIEKLYHTTGQAFYVIIDKSQRQLILNTQQLLEVFNAGIKMEFYFEKLNKIRVNVIMMLNSMKALLEEDLSQYRKLGKFKKFKSKLIVDYDRFFESKDKVLLLFAETDIKETKGGKK